MPAWPLLAFDIESIPDIAGLRALRQSDPGLDDAAVYAGEIAVRQELGGRGLHAIGIGNGHQTAHQEQHRHGAEPRAHP